MPIIKPLKYPFPFKPHNIIDAKTDVQIDQNTNIVNEQFERMNNLNTLLSQITNPKSRKPNKMARSREHKK